MSECNHDCGSCGENCEERKPGSLLAKLHEGSTVKKVIGVVSGKGGVGKSMVTSQLAVTMQRRGYRTAVLDADITGPSIPKSFGLKEKATGNESAIFPVQTKSGIQVMSINLLLENEEDPVLWRGPIIGSVVTQFWTDVLWDDVDYMFVDMPPGTGDVALSTFQSLPVDGIVIVASPQELVGVCPDCGKKISLFGESRSQEAAARHGLDLLAEMPIDPKLASLVDAGRIEDFEGDWMKAVADAVETLPNKVFEA